MQIEFNALHFEPIQQGGNVRLVVGIDMATAFELMRQLLEAIEREKQAERPAGPVLVFKAHNVIDWETGSEAFSPATYELLKAMWKSPKGDRSVTKARIVGEVLCNEENKCGSIWTCVSRARTEIAKTSFPYEIETQRGKGYRLKAM